MRTLKLTVAYDGTAYAGWQIQLGQRTLQETFERAIATVTGEPVRITASGRTDAGVHALGQVIGFRTECPLPSDILRRALNAELPRDVAVLDVAEAPEGFHATRDARRKRYRYVIDNGPVRDVFRRRYAWCYPAALDVEAMDRAARCLLGTHDFSSFESSGAERKTSVRTIYDIFVRRGDGAYSGMVLIEVEANGFLYNMVRAIVGSLIRVGRAAQAESWLAEVVAARDRRLAGQTAPPQGLFLVQVEYDGVPCASSTSSPD
jgi:tRNA pseudouridine38-40 synthase